MIRVAKVICAMALLSMLTASLVLAQQRTPPRTPPGSLGRRGMMGPAEHEKMMAEMQDRVLKSAGLTDKEMPVVRQAMEAKMKAGERLADALMRLQSVATKENATNAELRNAIAAYRRAMAQHQQTIAAQDKMIAAKVSLKAQARLLTMGILDNGVSRGMMALGRRMMGPGMMGGHSPMGMRRGGPGAMRPPAPR